MFNKNIAMDFLDSFTGLVAVILIFGLPVIAVVMGLIAQMYKSRKQKEIRQLIIENHLDVETARLLIDEPKKAHQIGTIDLSSLRFACVLLGVGLGTLIDWMADIKTGNLYFWLIIAFGCGVGLLIAFFVELHLYKKMKSREDQTNTTNMPK